jgi:tetratricopeptide (TPR) repeat protein
MMTEVEMKPVIPNMDELKLQAQSKPDDLESQYRYGWALLNLGMIQEARNVFENGHSHWPDSIEFIYGLGMVWKTSGDMQQAKANFNLVLEKEAVNVRGTMLKRLSEVQRLIIA